MLRIATGLLSVLATGIFCVATAEEISGPSLSETLDWMDKTYNSHVGDGGLFGHGLEERYTDGKLFSRQTESLSYKGCEITLQIREDANSPLFSQMYSSTTATFSLRDIDPQSIKILHFDSHAAGLPCDISPANMTCDTARLDFGTHNQEPLIEENSHTVFPKLQGKDHESQRKSKAFVQVFYLDNVDYANRFAKAFSHAATLCGGEPSPF